MDVAIVGNDRRKAEFLSTRIEAIMASAAHTCSASARCQERLAAYFKSVKMASTSLPPQDGRSCFEPYIDPLYPAGSIVLIKEPTHDFYSVTQDVMGLVYEAYVHRGFRMYAVLFKNTADCLDMKFMKPSTSGLSEELCCQHLDEDRLCLVTFQNQTHGMHSAP